MSVGENVRSALSEIWGHKLRSALTLVGVVLGVFSINCMFSIIQGVRGGISGLFSELGFDGMVFISGKPLDRDQRTAWNMASSATGITIADADAIRAALDGRAMVSAVTQVQAEVPHGAVRSTVKFEAGNEDYLTIRNFPVEKGRGITRADVLVSSPVAVIGPQVAHDLFAGEDPLGKQIPLRGIRYTVIGVLKKKERPQGMGGGGDMFEGNTVYIPITTARDYVYGKQLQVYLAIKTLPTANFQDVADGAETLLAARHRGAPDFEVENIAEEILQEKKDIDKMLSNFNIVLGCIAGTALLVGGIGILSVMLIAVSERLFEIGIRKAVGATDGEILFQFLVEASTLSAVGAVIGTGIALFFIQMLSSKFPWGLAVSTGGLGLAAFFAVGIGLGFGLYPAWLASRMDPVESLRAS
jgi:putative ABC transport system permease protein